MRPVTPTMSTLLYEDASGLQPTPSNGARVLTWITRKELSLGETTLAPLGVRRNPCAKQANPGFQPMFMMDFESVSTEQVT